MGDFELDIDTEAVASAAGPFGDLAAELATLPAQLRAACEEAAGACAHSSLASAVVALGDRFANAMDAKATLATSMAGGLSSTAAAYESIDDAFARAQQAISDAIPDLW